MLSIVLNYGIIITQCLVLLSVCVINEKQVVGESNCVWFLFSLAVLIRPSIRDSVTQPSLLHKPCAKWRAGGQNHMQASQSCQSNILFIQCIL